MAKELVFVVNTDKEGDAVYLARCAQRGGLDGLLKSITYIPDPIIPYAEGVGFAFSIADGGEVSKVENVTAGQTWDFSGPEFKGQSFKVVVSGGGEKRSGSFIVRST